jgi:ABC-type transport system substrate-binding protein
MHARSFRPLVAVVAALSVFAAGCGDDDPTPSDSATDEGQAITDVTIEDDGEPKSGGSLSYGVEAETDGWNPTSSQWAISGHLIGMTIFDTLAAYDETGEAAPYLAESFEVDDTGMTWTIGVRDGVKFHDGTPCDAAAIADALERFRTSFLTQGALEPVESVTVVDPSTIEVKMATPWFSFPATLTTQVGFIAAPAQLAAEGAASVGQPIGTGPFVFDEWVPDDQLTVVRNEDYWREGLPYLEEITFRPITDSTSRVNALLARDLDVIHTVSQESIADLQVEAGNGEIQLLIDPTEQEEYFLMPNQSKPPFNDLRARLAVAHAIDRDEYIETFGAGIVELATGVFVPGSKWYAESEPPAYDPEEATRLVEEYEAEVGPISITLGATNDPYTRSVMQSFVEDLEAVGIEVEAEYTEQAQQISAVVGGAYDIVDWRQFGAPDPDADYMWWHRGTGEAGAIDLNLAKIDNPDLDAALETGRTTDDPEVRAEAYATVQREMNENVHYIWLNHTQWAIGASNDVRDIENGPLPDGTPSLPFGAQVSGVHRLTQTWLDQ